LEGALDALDKLGAEPADLAVYKVPGTFEVPLVAKKLAKSKKVNGIVCLGALVRGDTPHFDYLSAEVTKGLAQLAMEEVPVSFGILTVDTVEQGIERAGTKSGNKGWDAAFSLVETLNLLKTAGLG
jgi:6,7-dimethyl-8-ribityllumazine synthase